MVSRASSLHRNGPWLKSARRIRRCAISPILSSVAFSRRMPDEGGARAIRWSRTGASGKTPRPIPRTIQDAESTRTGGNISAGPNPGAWHVADAKPRRALERGPKARLSRPCRARLNLPLTISVFTPLTLDRHPAAGRLPFGALAPEVGWVWQLPRYGGRNERAQVLARGGCCAGP